MPTLVTGARGRVARSLTTLLHAAGHPVRLGSRTPADLDAPSGVPAVALDLADPGTFGPALDGMTSVFLYAEPSHLPAFLAAARTAGVEHVVLLSTSAVLVPGAEEHPLAHHHVRAEAALAAAPLTSTVLRPGTFASNALSWAWAVRKDGAVRLPYPGAHTDPVHEADLAEAAFVTLTDPSRRGGTHHLTGPASLTFAEQIAVLGDAVGQDIRVVSVERAEWKADMAPYLPDALADALLDFWHAHDGVPAEITGGLAELTGRPPRSFAAWAADHAAAFAR